MKLTSPLLLKSLTVSSFILLVLVTSLAGIYLTQLWRVGDLAYLVMSGLFFLAVDSFMRENKTIFRFEIDIISVTLVIKDIILTFIKILEKTQQDSDYLISDKPYIPDKAVNLIASEWRDIKIFWKELTILFLLVFSSVII